MIGKDKKLIDLERLTEYDTLIKSYIDAKFGSTLRVSKLTQAQYDALTTKDAQTFYIITDYQP